MSTIKTDFGMGAATGTVAIDRSVEAKSLSKRAHDSPEAIEKAAGGFEALLLQEMMKSMWETVEFSGMFGEDSNQAGIYRDMFNQALSDSVASGEGIGVKKFLKPELEKAAKAS